MSKPDPYGPEWEKEFRKKTEEKLNTNEKIQAYFSNYSASSVKKFISTYIDNKLNWYRYNEHYERSLESLDDHWLDLAAQHLEVIQQKKLFDLQCQWRAEQVQLPGVEICFDFEIWEEDILNCPFLPPVTRDEVQMYKEYLASDDADLLDDYIWGSPEWQAYTDLKQEWETGKGDLSMPEWYMYHNNNTGASVYLLLPDVRGEKEEFYRDISFSEERRINDEKDKANPKAPAERKPDLNFYNEVDDFLERFEDRITKKYYRASCQSSAENDEEETYTSMLSVLLKADGKVPMLADPDWREGLRKTVHRYKAGKIIEAMDDALAQYELTRSMELEFAETGRPFHDLRDVWVKRILNGRKLNGEPENLDF